jgi:hypothetical protein
MIAVLGAFFDDSGTHASPRVVVIGGLLGTDEQWDAFASAWAALLAQPLPEKPPLSQFHLSPCRAAEGEFQSYNRTEIDLITHLFRRIILDLGFVTLAAAVNRSAWNELVVGDVAAQLGQRLPYPDPAKAEDSFRTALAIAREQGTRGYELRAATSLARLWLKQGRRTEARDLLAPLYGSFTEGFDTADLKEAKTLLDELA